MTTTTDELSRIADEGRQAVTAALTAWVEMAERYAKNFDPQHPVPAVADAHAAVDTVYDLADRLLAGQRTVATALLADGRQAGETVLEQARAFAPAFAAPTTG
jgi:hypothetical protein